MVKVSHLYFQQRRMEWRLYIRISYIVKVLTSQLVVPKNRKLHLKRTNTNKFVEGLKHDYSALDKYRI